MGPRVTHDHCVYLDATLCAVGDHTMQFEWDGPKWAPPYCGVEMGAVNATWRAPPGRQGRQEVAACVRPGPQTALPVCQRGETRSRRRPDVLIGGVPNHHPPL